MTPRTTRRPLTLLLCAVLLAPSAAKAASGPILNDAKRRLALQRLGVLGSVLYVGAHPDDENTAMLAYFSKGRLLRTGYLALTRGDGGQNLIGTEQGAALGVLRSQELLAARRIDGAEQFFTRAIDFGYSKSPEETFAVWGRERILADVVWVIRNFRPDLIVTRFPTDGQGGHGHHTASAILALEAFSAAADPSRFPEQLDRVNPWQATRIFWNTWRPELDNRPTDAPPLLAVDLGDYNALLGESYSEIAGRARSMHKSQGFGASSRRGSLPNYLELMGGPPPAGADPLSGVNPTWSRLSGGAAVQEAVERARRAYDPEHPERTVPALVEVLNQLDRLAADGWVEIKRREVLDLIRSCTGLWLEALVEDATATPGSTVKVTLRALNRSTAAVRLERIELPTGPEIVIGESCTDNRPVSRDVDLLLASDLPPSQPYWLVEPPDGSVYRVPVQESIGKPCSEPPVVVRFVLNVAGRELALPVAVEHRWTDPVQGELARPLEIVPPVLVNLDRPVILFPDPDGRRVSVRLRAGAPEVAGTLSLELPAGFAAEPSAQAFRLAEKGEESTLEFTVTPPSDATIGDLNALAVVGGRRYQRGVMTVDYSHIPTQTLLPPATSRLVRVDVRTDGRRVGYVMGAGDEIPDALRQMGYEVELLSDEQLSTSDLSPFDAIVAGVRAYNTREALAGLRERLLDYVRSGGTLVVQYNTSRGLVTDAVGPYSIALSHDRVTVEEAPVSILIPDHPLLSRPNAISSADFGGWVQERGLYFPGEWDVHYQAPLALADPGEPASKGSLLYAPYGKGVFVYTALSFFRELPAGVPGAYRLFANLLAGGKSGA